MSKSVLSQTPTSEEFIETLGRVTWLLSQSNEHKKKPIEWVEANVLSPLMFKQVRVFSKGKQPLAAISWAYASVAVLERLKFPQYELALPDWRSGPTIVVVDCISPFSESQNFKDAFLEEAKKANLSPLATKGH